MRPNSHAARQAMRWAGGGHGLALALFGGTAALAELRPGDVSMHPVWVAMAPDKTDETVVMQSRSYISLFKVRPKEAYAALDPVMTKPKKVLLPAGTQLMRAPGPQFIACEIVRKPGNERLTCLRDDNTDGVFDTVTRIPAHGNYFIFPIQAWPWPFKYEPLHQPVRYRGLDEAAEFRPVEFILRYSHLGDWGLIDFCFEPFRRKESWGFPHLVDACLVSTLRPKYPELPKSLAMHGFRVSALSFDPLSKAMSVRVQRRPEEYQVTFGFTDEKAE